MNNDIINKIEKSRKLHNLIFKICSILLFISIFIFIFFGFNNSIQSIKFITNIKNVKKITAEKIMINPKIKIEYGDHKNIIEIKADSAKYEYEKDIIMKNVKVDGDIGKIRAGKLKITNNGNDFIFTQNPKLEFYQNEQ